MDRLEHIHASLAQAMIRARGVNAFETPVTVAEIYQDLVPYRSVRTQLGFDMNADYEHTLLRLLAGEGELARLEPPEARSELQAELGAANPNVGLFRKFAGCDVWITRPRADGPVVDAPEPARVSHSREGDAWESRAALWMDPSSIPDATPGAASAPLQLPEEIDLAGDEGFELLLEDAIDTGDQTEGGTGLAAGPPSEAPATGASVTAGTPPASSPPPKPEVPGLSTTAQKAAGASVATAQPNSCAFCDSALPTSRAAKFCPFCGADQTLVPCGSCGEALEPAWRFCIACGADAGSAKA